MFYRLKNKYITWLSRELRIERERRKPSYNAMLADGSKIDEGAAIINPTNDANRICVGENTYILGRLLVFPHGGCIKIGDWCYVGHRTEIWSMDSVSIGNRVLISHNVNIIDTTAHSRDAVERHDHYYRILSTGHPTDVNNLPGIFWNPIVIEDDVWISFNVTILRGVRIGAGSIISAGSIVTKDVPPGVLYRNQVTPIITPIS
ncbi:MAG: acyltransferase [Chloroflexi bacterium HGW-Chloroflexi-6]|nr:MAG: acyltransferase [Chloroflexi bacterium HGW-Chloroflexi-6]